MCTPSQPSRGRSLRASDPFGKAARDSLMAVADGLEATASGLQPFGKRPRPHCVQSAARWGGPAHLVGSILQTNANGAESWWEYGEHRPLPTVGASFPVLEGETHSCKEQPP